VFEDEAGMFKLEDVQAQDLGRVAEVSISKEDCLLMKVSRSLVYVYWILYQICLLFGRQVC